MRHTLSKQTALSQPYLAEGTRGETEALGCCSFRKSLGFGARLMSKVWEKWWTNRAGGVCRVVLMGSCYLWQVNQPPVDLYKNITHCCKA